MEKSTGRKEIDHIWKENTGSRQPNVFLANSCLNLTEIRRKRTPKIMYFVSKRKIVGAALGLSDATCSTVEELWC